MMSTINESHDDTQGHLDIDARWLFEIAVLDVFRQWLYLPDEMPLMILLAAVVANRMPGDPVWLMLVGPPGSCKTELLGTVSGLPGMHLVSTLTEQALLSGTAARERIGGSTGGLLRQIGAFGFLLLKDFTSTLSMHREKRPAILAALREIYDGKWVRHLGVDGGTTLEWEGKLGVIAACTEAVDSAHGFTSAMGERFLFVRMRQNDEKAEANAVLETTGREQEMRSELVAAVSFFFNHFVRVPELPPVISPAQEQQLIALASLAVRCRSGVERHGFQRDIVQVNQPERPTRMTRCLKQLLAAMPVLHVSDHMAWKAVVRVALDSMPATRRKVLKVLANYSGLKITSIAALAPTPETAARRALEDLEAHGVVTRRKTVRGDEWSMSDWTTEQVRIIGSTFPNCLGDA